MARLMIAALAVLCGFASGQGDRGPQSGRISSAPFPGAPPAPRPIIPGSTPDSLPPEYRRVIPPIFGQSLARWRTPLPAEMNHSHTRTKTFAWSSTWTSLSDEESSLIRNVTIRCSFPVVAVLHFSFVLLIMFILLFIQVHPPLPLSRKHYLSIVFLRYGG